MSRVLGLTVLCALAATTFVASSSRQGDTNSCNLFRTSFPTERANGDIRGALRTLDLVTKGCQQQETRAEALVQIGRLSLELWPPNLVDAKRAADLLAASPYLDTRSGPEGFMLYGMVEMAGGRNFVNALAEFRRVNGLKVSSDAIAEAQYRIGETRRLNHQDELAMQIFLEIPLKYPRSEWSARALISAASCQVRQGEFAKAMGLLQRVRRDFPTLREAELALQRNGVIYRLAMKGTRQDLVPVMNTRQAYREGVALTVDRQGRILVAHQNGLATLSPDTLAEISNVPLTGNLPFGVSAVGMWGDVAAVARERGIVRNRADAPVIKPSIPTNDGADEVEVAAFISNWRGEWIVADAKSASIRKYDPEGRHVGLFAQRMKAVRMAQNDLDDVAVLDTDVKGVWVLDRNAANQQPIPKRGPDRVYEFDQPEDVAFDVLGNIYVLDAGLKAVVAFDPALRFKSIMTLPKTMKNPVALVVDGRGRIYVLERQGQVVAFQ